MGILKDLFSPKKNPGMEIPKRNDLCWCGSGKKYKKCHLVSDEEKRLARVKVRSRG